jgi:RNA polymerase sigma factor (sigma-70 family)
MGGDALELLVEIREDRDTPAAQEALYLLVRGALLEHLEKRLRGRLQPRLDAEDVLHDAFLRVLGGLVVVEFPSQKAFLAWVWRIARNLMIDQAKRRSAGALRLGGSAPGESGPDIAGISPKRRVESTICRSDWIESVLGRMKAREAEVIRLRWLRGMTYEEIGRNWKKTPVAIKRFYMRAWERFRTLAKQDTLSG